MGASSRTKTWRHRLVGAAALLAVCLLAALTWQTVAGRRTAAATNDGFLVVRRSDGTPAADARVVALRGERVRWARDTDAHGVVPFKRGGGRIEVRVLGERAWGVRARVDLGDAFVDLDLPPAPAGASRTGPRVVGNWRYDDLASETRSALENPGP